MFLRWSLLSLLGLLCSTLATSSTGNSVLVVLDPALDRDNFSRFFDGLAGRGYELTFRAPKDVKPAVIADDVAQFAHVVLFAPDAKSTCRAL